MNLNKNADTDKYGYSGYGIEFDARSQFPLPDGSWGKNIIIFGVDNSSSTHFDNRKNDILVLSKGPTKKLDDTTIIAEAKYPISFTKSGKNFLLRLHYNGSNSFLFVNTGLKEVVNVFPVDYNAIDTNDILDIHRYLIKET